MAYDTGIIYLHFGQIPISPSIFSGHSGEHNAHTLHVIPSPEILNNSKVEYYRLVFKPEDGDPVHSREILTSELAEDNSFDFDIPASLTGGRFLNIQLEAYSQSGDFIAKTDVIEFLLRRSIEGDAHDIDDELETMAQEIMDRLDALEDKAGTVEIWDTGSKAKYTSSELTNMMGQGYRYKGYPVIGWRATLTYFEFVYLRRISVGLFEGVEYIRAQVDINKNITEYAGYRLPLTVNGKSADYSGNIYIEATDILTAGENITIENGVISATGGEEYTAGDNITIEDGVISATDTQYTAGAGITIDNGVISVSYPNGDNVNY